jgi:hypothetical protein
MYSAAIFEPVTNLGKNILQSSETAAHDLASKTIDAAKFTKIKTEEILHHPTHEILRQPRETLQPAINKHHPHLRSVTNPYTQVR